MSDLCPNMNFISDSVSFGVAQNVIDVLRNACPVYSSGFGNPSTVAIQVPVFADVLCPTYSHQ